MRHIEMRQRSPVREVKVTNWSDIQMLVRRYELPYTVFHLANGGWLFDQTTGEILAKTINEAHTVIRGKA